MTGGSNSQIIRPDPLAQQEISHKSPQSVSEGSLQYRPPHVRAGSSLVGSPYSSPTVNGSSTPGSIRPRSLFTSHNGHEAGEGFSNYADFAKFSRANGRDWSPPHLADGASLTSNYDSMFNYPAGMGGRRGGSGFSPVYFNNNVEDDAYYFGGDCHSEDSTGLGAVVTPQGIMSIRLHSGVRVDITADKAIRVVNTLSRIIMAVSPSGSSAALIHPSGKVYQYGSRVEITTTDCNGYTKYAKMFYKGVSFTSDTCALVYLVDQAGTRTTTDNFSDMHGDYSIPVFLEEAYYGPHAVPEATNILRSSQFWVTEDGVENWVINGIRVSQTPDGLVRVGRGTSKYQIRTSPLNGTATLTTPFVHSTASMGIPTPTGSGGPHLFVKRVGLTGERRLHFDGLTFIVRNAGHASGFDEFNQLKVY